MTIPFPSGERPRPKRRTAVLFLRYFPVDVKDLFKAICVRRGTSMRQAVEDFMIGEIRKDEPQASRRLRDRENKVRNAQHDR